MVVALVRVMVKDVLVVVRVVDVLVRVVDVEVDVDVVNVVLNVDVLVDDVVDDVEAVNVVDVVVVRVLVEVLDVNEVVEEVLVVNVVVVVVEDVYVIVGPAIGGNGMSRSGGTFNTGADLEESPSELSDVPRPVAVVAVTMLFPLKLETTSGTPEADSQLDRAEILVDMSRYMFSLLLDSDNKKCSRSLRFVLSQDRLLSTSSCHKFKISSYTRKFLMLPLNTSPILL